MNILFLLQTTSEDQKLDQVVQSLTKSSIDLAEAASNYGALKVVFGVFLVFILVMLLMFIYTILNLNKKIGKISESSKNINEFFNGAADHTLGITESQILLRRSMNSLSVILKYYILRIRLENHIDDHERTKHKVESIVNNEYSELIGFFSNYFCDSRPLSEIIDNRDIDSIMDFMMEQIYISNEDFTVSSMDQAVTIFINGIKQIYIKKL